MVCPWTGYLPLTVPLSLLNYEWVDRKSFRIYKHVQKFLTGKAYITTLDARGLHARQRRRASERVVLVAPDEKKNLWHPITYMYMCLYLHRSQWRVGGVVGTFLLVQDKKIRKVAAIYMYGV